MKKITLMLFVLFISINCGNDDDDDALNDPIANLAWLQEKVINIENNIASGATDYTYISQSVYNLGIVFTFNNCCAACSTVVPVYNFEGEFIGIVGDGSNETIDSNLVIGNKIIWVSENNECIFL